MARALAEKVAREVPPLSPVLRVACVIERKDELARRGRARESLHVAFSEKTNARALTDLRTRRDWLMARGDDCKH